tara:strand:+ start:214 stop:507 length:294 start_codon:yes stop_codon:yes gene_type:complete
MKLQPISEMHPEALYLEPRKYFDKALVGVIASPIDHWPRVESMNIAAYNIDLCINAIQEWMECTQLEAAEWFNYNTAGAWCGEGTPTFVETEESEAL